MCENLLTAKMTSGQFLHVASRQAHALADKGTDNPSGHSLSGMPFRQRGKWPQALVLARVWPPKFHLKAPAEFGVKLRVSGFQEESQCLFDAFGKWIN
jgi:hypothetical protein